MAERKQFEFQLVRYVPDPIKNEFVNIGVVVRTIGESAPDEVRFARDWGRVRCIDPDADIAMLELLESEIAQRLRNQHARLDDTKPLMPLLHDSLSHTLQITEPKAFLAESMPAGLEQLLSMYVNTAKRPRDTKRGGRLAIHAAMRTQFEQAGVWPLMRKQIAVAHYTKTGDPLRIDCGYRPNGLIRMFHAISLENDLDAAKVLAFSAHAIKEGVSRVEKAALELTAIVEPIRQAESTEPDNERVAMYRFAVETMEESEIRVLTTSDLPRVAETARRELRV